MKEVLFLQTFRRVANVLCKSIFLCLILFLCTSVRLNTKLIFKNKYVHIKVSSVTEVYALFLNSERKCFTSTELCFKCECIGSTNKELNGKIASITS